MNHTQKRHRFYVELVEKQRVSPTLLHLVFHATRDFDFRPGQFISLRKPRTEGGLGRPRCYSIAGSVQESRDGGRIELCVALREHLSVDAQRASFPHYLDSLSLGQRLECEGPFGNFVWDEGVLERALQVEPRVERVCWIGTGSGIAPLRSMILSGFGPSAGALKSYVLLQGARNREQLIYEENFRSISALEYHPCLSRSPKAGPGYFQCRVSDQLRLLAKQWDFSRTLFMICGSHTLVSDLQRILVQEFHTPEAFIFAEGFGEAVEELKVA
jgi:ferredoxin-NADP reductase